MEETEKSTSVDQICNKSAIKILEEEVNKLYNFRDYYFKTHNVDCAKNRKSDINDCLQDTLAVFKDLEEAATAENKAQYCYLLGKAYNIQPDVHNPKAEDLLSKAAKLNPNSTDAWNQLGICLENRNEDLEAVNCFKNALSKEANKVSLVHLSYLTRRNNMNVPHEKKVENITSGVEYAKQALKLDFNDGLSWLTMGNAYISHYFNIEQSPEVLSYVIFCYSKAEQDIVSESQSDFHFNRAAAFKYLEEYEECFKAYSRATALDPNWSMPQISKDKLLKYLRNFNDFINQKGRIKPKKLQDYIKEFGPKYLGPYRKMVDVSSPEKKLDYVPISKLTGDGNKDKIITGVVVCSIQNEDEVPFTFCIVDEENTCVGVTVYNLAASEGFLIGDYITIVSPFLKIINFTHEGENFKFKSIRIDKPGFLIVNGKKIPKKKLGAMQMSSFNSSPPIDVPG